MASKSGREVTDTLDKWHRRPIPDVVFAPPCTKEAEHE